MAAPIFDIRHGQAVRLVKFPERSDFGLKIGQLGKVIAMKNSDGIADYLVKWQGDPCPIAVKRSEIKPA